MPKRHNWCRDELILALELYFREPSARGNKSHPEVLKLSAFLKEHPVHPAHHEEGYLRNLNGVSMKLSNFLRLDPDYEGTGLSGGSKLDEEIWQEFGQDRARLAVVATRIRDLVRSPDQLLSPDKGDDEAEAFEGRVLTRNHQYRERSQALVRRKKAQVIGKFGRLACEACGFDFEAFYGERGREFAECHHTLPLSELTSGHRTRTADLAIVCANCHRIIHRSRPWLTVPEVTDLISRAVIGQVVA